MNFVDNLSLFSAYVIPISGKDYEEEGERNKRKSVDKMMLMKKTMRNELNCENRNKELIFNFRWHLQGKMGFVFFMRAVDDDGDCASCPTSSAR